VPMVSEGVGEGLAEALDVDSCSASTMTRASCSCRSSEGRHGHCRRGQIGLRLRRGRLPGAFPRGGFERTFTLTMTCG